MKSASFKQSLIALAAISAMGIASADSAVQITGALDLGIKSTDVSNDATKKKQELTNNNTTTSLVYLKGFRDIAGGMRASFLLEMDVNAANNNSLNGAANGSQAWTGTPFNGEQYIALAGGFGEVKLGMPNSAGLTAGLTAQPYGTALGGGYSGAFGRMGTASFSGINTYDGGATGRIIRHERTMMYYTPVLSGFKATVEYSIGNDNSTSITANSNTNTGLSLQYNAGPLNAIYYYGNEKAGSNGAAGPATVLGTAPAVALPAGTDVTWNMLAANYTMGSLTLMGGYTTTKHNATVALEDSSSWNIAAKYVLSPTWEFTGNYLVRDSALAKTYDATLIGAGVNYFLDKQTNLYGRYEGISFTNNSDVTKANYDQTILAAGVRYQF